jgi:hypothetical protein
MKKGKERRGKGNKRVFLQLLKVKEGEDSPLKVRTAAGVDGSVAEDITED